jgi:hypothetical protein
VFDLRLYRTSLLIVLLAVMATAFSLKSRPAPITTQIAPDAFSTLEATRTLASLSQRFPDRRPGSIGDSSLGREVLTQFDLINKSAKNGTTASVGFTGQTIDGKRDLQNVSLIRPGQPGPPIVVVAHRDAAGSPAIAELSGTAVMLELARVTSRANFKRTLIFVSTSGGSGGLAGATHLASQLSKDPPMAVLVIGDVANKNIRRPSVVGWSNGKGQAPFKLQRSVAASVREETGREASGSRAPKQWGRMAFPLTTGEQGAFNRKGIPSVLLQVSGELGPGAKDPISKDRLQDYGRSALRTIYAFDGTKQSFGGRQATLVAHHKVIPYWAIQLLVGSLLLVPMIVSIDGYARIRRRSERVGRWSIWTLSWSLPFILASIFVTLLHLIGVISVAPPAPISGQALDVDTWTTIGIASIFVLFVLTLIYVRPFVLRWLAPDTIQQRPATEGAAMGVMLVMCSCSLVAWAVNAYAAALLIPAAHLWLVALSPQMHLRRRYAVPLVLLSFAPFVILALLDASSFGWSFSQLLWSIVLLIAGGHASVPIWMLSALILGCLMSALVVAARLERDPVPPLHRLGLRGPGSYFSSGPTDESGKPKARRPRRRLFGR